jgi:hypothetical protein
LSPGSSLETYIRQGDDVAIVDAAKITDQKQKELANSLRKIEIKKANTVSHPIASFLSFLFLCYEENIPNAKRLMRRKQSVLGCAAPVRAFLFIVTLSIHHNYYIVTVYEICGQLLTIVALDRTSLLLDLSGSTSRRQK